VINRREFLPFQTGVEIIKHTRARHSANFKWKAPPYEYDYRHLPIEVLIGGPVQALFPQ
jgi:hypothetical protein